MIRAGFAPHAPPRWLSSELAAPAAEGSASSSVRQDYSHNSLVLLMTACTLLCRDARLGNGMEVHSRTSGAGAQADVEYQNVACPSRSTDRSFICFCCANLAVRQRMNGTPATITCSSSWRPATTPGAPGAASSAAPSASSAAPTARRWLWTCIRSVRRVRSMRGSVHRHRRVFRPCRGYRECLMSPGVVRQCNMGADVSMQHHAEVETTHHVNPDGSGPHHTRQFYPQHMGSAVTTTFTETLMLNFEGQPSP